MIDQEQTTSTTETPNSEEETSSSATQEQSSSTTDQSQTPTDESISLSQQQQTEDQTQTEETEDEKAAREERETLFGAPAEGEAYQLEGLPEGTVIDEEALADIAPIARQLGLSNKGLSAVAGVYAEKILPRVAQQVVSGIETDITAKHAEWEGQSRDLISGKAEPLKNAKGEELGFGTTDSKAVLGTAAKALDKLAPEGFRAWLDETGLAKHPQMIAFAFQAGQLVAEDTDVEPVETGGKKSQTPASTIRRSGGLDPAKFYDH